MWTSRGSAAAGQSLKRRGSDVGLGRPRGVSRYHNDLLDWLFLGLCSRSLSIITGNILELFFQVYAVLRGINGRRCRSGVFEIFEDVRT